MVMNMEQRIGDLTMAAAMHRGGGRQRGQHIALLSIGCSVVLSIYAILQSQIYPHRAPTAESERPCPVSGDGALHPSNAAPALDTAEPVLLPKQFARRGVVLMGEGCYVPVAFVAAIMVRVHTNMSVTLFTNEGGVAMVSLLNVHFQRTPFDMVIDATSLLSRHSGSERGRTIEALARDDKCAFRLQKILAIARSPYEHSLVMDGDAFPCSPRMVDLFDVHDAQGGDVMVTWEPTRPKFNGGFHVVRRSLGVDLLTAGWFESVSDACERGTTLNREGRVLDQPSFNRNLHRLHNAGKLTYSVAPYDLEPCRPEVWKGNANETRKYLEIRNLPLDMKVDLESICPIAHVNCFKDEGMLVRRVDPFCSTGGLGNVSKLIYRAMQVIFNREPNSFGSLPQDKVNFCWPHIHRLRPK